MDECEAAAAMLGVPDTSATLRNTLFKVPGCYVLPNGNLEFNANMNRYARMWWRITFDLTCATDKVYEPPAL